MKILATDYDGTLCYGHQVMQEDLDAINEWKEAGNLFVIVTGRSKESIDKQIEKYDIPCDYVVTNNGGMVFDKDGNILLSNYLDYITSIDLFYAVKFFESVVSYVVNDGINRHRIIVNPEAEDHRYPTFKPDIDENAILDMQHYAQIVLSMSDMQSAIEMAKNINDFFYDTVVAYPNNFVVDIVPKNISKASGLDFVCEYADVDEFDVYTIGDGYNDIPLMEYGMHGCAISSAVYDVKEHASQVYDSVSDLIHSVL